MAYAMLNFNHNSSVLTEKYCRLIFSIGEKSSKLDFFPNEVKSKSEHFQSRRYDAIIAVKVHFYFYFFVFSGDI